MRGAGTHEEGLSASVVVCPGNIKRRAAGGLDVVAGTVSKKKTDESVVAVAGGRD